MGRLRMLHLKGGPLPPSKSDRVIHVRAITGWGVQPRVVQNGVPLHREVQTSTACSNQRLYDDPESCFGPAL